MKIKVPNIQFIAFNDGICDIYTEDEEGNKTYKYEKLNFSNKTLGYGRYFTALSENIKVDRVIKIPLVTNINSQDICSIGNNVFSIELIQETDDTNPRSMILTLKGLSIHG